MRIPNIYITDELEELEVRVVGYKNLGESIIVNIGKSFCMVVDSYKCARKFLTKEILKDELNISELSILCWTHPDEDHTSGLRELFDFVGKNTYILIPSGISSKEIEKSINAEGKATQEEWAYIYSRINEFADENKSKLICCNNSTTLTFNIIYNDKSYNCLIEAFAPMSSMLRDKEINHYKKIIEGKNNKDYLNLYSIALKICIETNNIQLCLTGDLDNSVIDVFKEDYKYYKDFILNNNNVFKIPHHGSKNSSQIFDYMNKFDFGIGTAFKRGRGKEKLPIEWVMDKYCKFGQVYCTRHEKPLEGLDYGVVHIRIPLFDAKNQHCELLYDACEWKNYKSIP